MIISIRPFISSITWLALVGLGRPERFALGAAIGILHSCNNALATKWDGIRIATVSRPPVVSYGILSAFGKIMVNGPGQNTSASASARAIIFSLSVFISG